MSTATVTSKGQVTIPKRIREILRVDTGDQLDFIVTDEGEIIVRAANRDLRELRGLLPKPARAASLEDMDQAIAERAKARAGVAPAGHEASPERRGPKR